MHNKKDSSWMWSTIWSVIGFKEKQQETVLRSAVIREQQKETKHNTVLKLVERRPCLPWAIKMALYCIRVKNRDITEVLRDTGHLRPTLQGIASELSQKIGQSVKIGLGKSYVICFVIIRWIMEQQAMNTYEFSMEPVWRCCWWARK